MIVDPASVQQQCNCPLVPLKINLQSPHITGDSIFLIVRGPINPIGWDFIHESSISLFVLVVISIDRDDLYKPPSIDVYVGLWSQKIQAAQHPHPKQGSIATAKKKNVPKIAWNRASEGGINVSV